MTQCSPGRASDGRDGSISVLPTSQPGTGLEGNSTMNDPNFSSGYVPPPARRGSPSPTSGAGSAAGGHASRIRAEQYYKSIRRNPFILDRAELFNIKIQETHAVSSTFQADPRP